jgi:hypothetical protein
MNVRNGLGAIFAAVLLFASAPGFAGGPAAVRKQIEASMLVTGRIQVDTTGKVTGFSLDQQDKLPPGIVRLLDTAVPAWTFEPFLVDGRAVNVSTDMSVRVVGKKLDEDSVSIAIRSASFGDRSGKPEEQPRSAGMAPPDYPLGAAYAGASGTVYLLVKAGRDGKVIDVATEQVNLTVVADESSMAQWRRVFQDASVRQAKRWKFIPPTAGEDAKSDFWVLRVPVVFALDDPRKTAAYGKWEAYVPGPRLPNPWEEEGDENMAFSPDALPPGGVYLAGSGLKLLTKLSGG